MSAAPYRAWVVPGKTPARTCRLVADIARLYGQLPQMRAITVLGVLDPGGVPSGDSFAAVEAIHAYVRDRIRFVPESGEQILTPGRVMLWGFGDCDDKTGLVAAMAESIRLPWRIRMLGRSGPGGVRPFHVWPQVWASGRWRDVETCDSRAMFDEHPRDVLARSPGLNF